MKYVFLVIAVLALGCGSTESVAVQETPEGMTMLSDEDLEPVLGNLRDAWSEHLRDCQTGLEFTYRAIYRNTQRDWERMKRTFD